MQTTPKSERGEAASARSAADRLVPEVYRELRRLAGRCLARERSGHTLQATALVHEVYVSLSKQTGARFGSRAHFCRVAAEAMRRILVNHARDRERVKRGGGARRLSLEESELLAPGLDVDLLELDEALERFERVDARKVRIVHLRFFGGLTIEETAEATGISPAQVKRDWTLAKAWLLRELSGGADR